MTPGKGDVLLAEGDPDVADVARWCEERLAAYKRPTAVTVVYALPRSPAGKLLGRIRIPEICGNVCFGGPKRNRLFMAASQSLYAVYTATQGASPG